MRERTRSIDDPRARLVETILEAVREVRARPDLSAWLEAGPSGFTARLSRRPELIDSLAGAITASLDAPGAPDRDRRLARRWIVRVIVPLLSMPGEDDAEENAFVSRFVVPALVGPPAP